MPAMGRVINWLSNLTIQTHQPSGPRCKRHHLCNTTTKHLNNRLTRKTTKPVSVNKFIFASNTRKTTKKKKKKKENTNKSRKKENTHTECLVKRQYTRCWLHQQAPVLWHTGRSVLNLTVSKYTRCYLLAQNSCWYPPLTAGPPVQTCKRPL